MMVSTRRVPCPGTSTGRCKASKLNPTSVQMRSCAGSRVGQGKQGGVLADNRFDGVSAHGSAS